MKRTIVGIALCTAALAGGIVHAGVTVAEQRTDAVQRTAAPQPPRWAEDSLPPQLYLWATTYHGSLVAPRRADRWANAYRTGDRRHAGCWAAVADTTLIMCPDGMIAYS